MIFDGDTVKTTTKQNLEHSGKFEIKIQQNSRRGSQSNLPFRCRGFKYSK